MQEIPQKPEENFLNISVNTEELPTHKNLLEELESIDDQLKQLKIKEDLMVVHSKYDAAKKFRDQAEELQRRRELMFVFEGTIPKDTHDMLARRNEILEILNRTSLSEDYVLTTPLTIDESINLSKELEALERKILSVNIQAVPAERSIEENKGQSELQETRAETKKEPETVEELGNMGNLMVSFIERNSNDAKAEINNQFEEVGESVGVSKQEATQVAQEIGITQERARHEAELDKISELARNKIREIQQGKGVHAETVEVESFAWEKSLDKANTAEEIVSALKQAPGGKIKFPSGFILDVEDFAKFIKRPDVNELSVLNYLSRIGYPKIQSVANRILNKIKAAHER